MAEKNGKKILIVDDEQDVRTYLSTLLEDNGFEVFTAENGKIALEKAVSMKPDLISLDITMPEETGTKALRELHDNSATNHIPVFIVTGVDPAYKQFIGNRKQVNPPAAFFEKPIDRQEFLSKVKEELGL